MEHLQFLLLGLGNGAVFAALGLGLVVTFRSSGVVNFAVGALALYAGYTYAFLRSGELFSPFPGTPSFIDLGGDPGLFPSLLIAVGVSTVLSLVIYLLVFRPLRHAPPTAAAVASLGVMIMAQAVMAQRVGTRPVNVAAIFPRDTARVGDATIQLDRVWFAATVVVLGLALAALYRFTSFGLRTRAAASSEKGAIVTGLAPDRIAAANWAITGVVTGLAGVLIAPISPLVPVSYTLFVIPALAAALVGQFRAIAPTAIGGIALGMLQSEATFLQVRLDWLPNWVIPSGGLPELLPLLLILLVLVVRARPFASRGVELRESLGAAPRPRGLLAPSLIGFAVGAAAILLMASAWRLALITSMAMAVISLSLVVVTGYGGQVSLAQLTLAGTAGFLLSTMGDDWGVPFPFAPLLAATGATIVGVGFGLPALRLRGLSLGVVTLALAAALEAVWFRNNDFNGGPEGARIAEPSLFGIDLDVGSGLEFPREEFAFLCLAVLVASGAAVAALRRSRFGAALMAVRVNERAAAAAGVDVVRVKLVAFATASFIAGLGGALTAYRQGFASFDLFATLAGLGLFATVYLAGITSVSGALLAGGLAANGLMYKLTDNLVGIGDWYNGITGLMLILTIVAFPDGLVGPVHRAIGRRVGGVPIPPPAPPTEPTGDRTVDTDHPALRIEDLTVRYGNVVAANRVCFDVPTASITGLIGPNGAGKSTLLDALSGFTPHDGQVLAPWGRIDRLPPYRRARNGIGRTFQSAQLCGELTVLENVAIGLSGGGSEADLGFAIAATGLGDLLGVRVSDLSQGRRQTVALARALASRPDVLLLDEPAGGLDSSESRQLVDQLRRIRDHEVTIVVVDHDMSLIMEVCDRVVVLDFGTVIANGPPDVVRHDPLVAQAYLGRTGVAE